MVSGTTVWEPTLHANVGRSHTEPDRWSLLSNQIGLHGTGSLSGRGRNQTSDRYGHPQSVFEGQNCWPDGVTIYSFIVVAAGGQVKIAAYKWGAAEPNRGQ